MVRKGKKKKKQAAKVRNIAQPALCDGSRMIVQKFLQPDL